MPNQQRHSNLRMYAEIRSSLTESVDGLKDLAEQLKGQFVIVQGEQDDPDEIFLKPNLESPGASEIKISSRKLYFSMDACPDYHLFIIALKGIFKKISGQVLPKEILCIGVQGCYLYPLLSFQEFTQLAFSWTGNYMNKNSLMEINDLGVTVYFHEGSLKVNLACKIMTQEQAVAQFQGTDPDAIAKLNLFINIDVSTEDPVNMDSAANNAIAQAIKDQVHRATHLIEERLGQKIDVDSSSNVS